MEVHALRKRGWSISAIARHTGSTARRSVGTWLVTARPGCGPGPTRILLEPFVDYVTAGWTEDPHLWGPHPVRRTRGAGGSVVVSSLTRNIRTRDLRPV